MPAPTFHCPACKKVYLARADAVGEQFRCDCGQHLIVPNLDPEQLAAASSNPYDLVPEWQPIVNEDEPAAPKRQPTVAANPVPMPEVEYDDSPRQQTVAAKWGPRRETEETDFDRDAEFARAARRNAVLNWSVVVIIAFVLAFALVASIMHRLQKSPGGVAAKVASSAFPNPDDEDVAQLTQNQGATEIRQWMKASPKHWVLGLTPAEAEQCAKMWYGMGAVKVLAFGDTTTRYLAIELPDDPAKRAALFDWENRFAAANRQEGAKDEGQKYILIGLK